MEEPKLEEGCKGAPDMAEKPPAQCTSHDVTHCVLGMASRKHHASVGKGHRQAAFQKSEALNTEFGFTGVEDWKGKCISGGAQTTAGAGLVGARDVGHRERSQFRGWCAP